MMKNQQTELSILGTLLNEDVLSQVTGGNPFTPDQRARLAQIASNASTESRTYTDALLKHEGASVFARSASIGADFALELAGFEGGQALVKKLKGH